MKVEELAQSIKDGIEQDAVSLRHEFCVGVQEFEEDEADTHKRLLQVDELIDAVRVDERERIAAVIRTLLLDEEYTWPDGKREFFCSDWCWEHALEAVLTEMGCVEEGDADTP